MSASSRIPELVRPLVSEAALKTLDLVEKFVEEECIPGDVVLNHQVGYGSTYQRFATQPAIVEDLKRKAKQLGLWNLFLPKNHYKHAGAKFSNVEYGLMCEILGRSKIAPEVTNSNPPDTGNMELLLKYANTEQQERWLKPLMNGDIRSAFCMTEPDVASSDATQISMSMKKRGASFVLNGEKWWQTGIAGPNCRIYIVVAKSLPDAPAHRQHSVILVPADTPGITITRMLGSFGYDDAPTGHGQMIFKDVTVPAANLILEEGRGFEILQGRLGPGRIHHAMRSIGSAERALEYFLARLNDPRKRPFGKQLGEQGVMLERVATSRIEIDAARLQVLNAAAKIDVGDAKYALKEIAEAKVLVPDVLLRVLDRAIEAHGAEGLSQNTPLAEMRGAGATMAYVDGPSNVHAQQLGKNENKRGREMLAKISRQEARADEMLRQYGLKRRDPFELVRENSKL